MRALALCLALTTGCGLITHRPPSDYFLTADIPQALHAPVRAGLTRAFADLRLTEAPRGDVLVINYGACDAPDFAGQVEAGPPNAITLCAGTWGVEASSPPVRAQRILALFHAVGHALDAEHSAGDDVMATEPSPARLVDAQRDEDHFHYTDGDMRNICAHVSIPSCK